LVLRRFLQASSRAAGAARRVLKAVLIELFDDMLRYKFDVFDHEPAGIGGVTGTDCFQDSPVLLENGERSVAGDCSAAVFQEQPVDRGQDDLENRVGAGLA
jgi:hypothetical protein